MRLYSGSEALYEADAAFASASLVSIQRLYAQIHRRRIENVHVQHSNGNVRHQSKSGLSEIQQREGEIVFAVRVSPRASRNTIEANIRARQKYSQLRRPSPPRRLLAEPLKVPVSAARIVAGE
jgi:hypothetical protein